MAKILVQTPVTSNGRDVVIGSDGKVVYKETIVEAAARPTFEKINKTLQPVLQHKISDYVPPKEAIEPPVKTVKPKADATI